jgi:transposase-like protein
LLVLYADDRSTLTRVSAALPPEPPAVLTDDWAQVERTLPDASCSVVLIEWLHSSADMPRLRAFKSRHPTHPVILVTRWDPENARRLKDVSVEEVVWLREVERELPGVVHRSCRRDFHFLRCLAVPFEEAEHLPPTLRGALAYACRSEVPVASVKQLAAAMGCDRRTLWHQWSRGVDGQSTLRLQDFLHWLLLVRAVGMKVPGQSWAQVAEELGVHPHTLGRLARQLTGRTLRETCEKGDEVPLLFRERVVDFLLNGCRLDIL